MNNLKVLVLLGLILCFSTCTSNKSEETMDQLTGLWMMDSALRNGKTITTLENVFFEFDENGQLTSNLPLSVKSTEFTVLYEIEKNNIQYTVDDIQYTLQIDQLNDSLIINTQLQNTPFQMVLVRQAGTESGE